MEKAAIAFEWVDYATVEEGKALRNDLAHRGELLSPDECLRYIRAIEQQLKAWTLL